MMSRSTWTWRRGWRALAISLMSMLAFAFVACTPDQKPPDPPDKPKPKSYTAKLSFVPANPIPNQPASLTVQFSDKDGEVLKGVTVTLSAKSKGGKSVEATLKEEGSGSFAASKLVFNDDSEWELSFKFKVGETESTAKETLNITCNGDKSAGAACCQASQCGDGLSCVYGSCQKEKAAPEKPCYAAAGCLSGICKDNACVAPSCEDKIANGKESDVDCGGGCGPCADKLKCAAGTDCLSGTCNSGVCAPSRGGLIGPPGEKKANWTMAVNLGGTITADVAFHNVRTNEMWIVHPKVDGLTIMTDAGTPDAKRRYIADRSEHFMEEVQGLSFSDNDTFGTCGDSRNTYGGRRPPNDFMGPVLWDSTYDLIDKIRQSFHEVHLDMLHSTPQCMGIAAETANKYFVFNGQSGTIDWYDFGKPHVPGGDDHSDGVKRRFSEVKVRRRAGVPSNLVYDKNSKWLYIADTGNARVIRINVSEAKNTTRLRSFGGDGVLWDTQGVKIEVLVKPGIVQAPTGLALHDGVLYVADTNTGKLHAFDADDGKLLNTKDTGLGSDKLGGMDIGPDKKLYVVDMSGRILRIDP